MGGNNATLAQLRRRVLQAADMVNMQTLVPQGDYTELDGYINDSLSELHDLLVLRFEDYFRTVAFLDVTANVEKTSLPANFYKEIGLYTADGSGRSAMRRTNGSHASNYTTDSSYDITGDGIILTPKPNASAQIELWYVPQYRKLVSDTDSVEYGVVNGWEEYIVVDAAIKIRDKLQIDCSVLMNRKEGLLRRIEMAASDRNIGQPSRVVDVRHGRFL